MILFVWKLHPHTVQLQCDRKRMEAVYDLMHLVLYLFLDAGRRYRGRVFCDLLSHVVKHIAYHINEFIKCLEFFGMAQMMKYPSKTPHISSGIGDVLGSKFWRPCDYHRHFY